MKRSLKRLLSLLLAVMLLTAAACPVSLAAKQSGTCGPNAKWSYDSKKKTITISGKGKIEDGWQGPVVGKKVNVVVKKGITGIGSYAFNRIYIKKISLPNTLKSIDMNGITSKAGMGGRSPDNLTIPKSVTKLAPDAVSAWKNINVEKGNKKYASVKGVLFNKKKTKLLKCPYREGKKYTIPKGTKEIEEFAFWSSRLKQLVIPEGVTKVGQTTFGVTGEMKELVFLGKKPPTGLFIYGGTQAQNVFYRERYQDNWLPIVEESRTNGFTGKWWSIYTGKWA